ncbi:uncharacterized protein Dwil_GK10320 [Drosophila willistoni]|uniref:CCC domain-containing protein n=1 Tax=Drosophila willistoni TaxID=7260 RepID=B4MJ33_DROWI|nr:glycine-rich cell wall structural protein [Drosophila willistoni]EDW72122.1 uncharacterized protein Dwil_GK10320 [Drosophila willistoni]
MIRIHSLAIIGLMAMISCGNVLAKQDSSARQFGGQNFGNGLGPVGLGGIGGNGGFGGGNAIGPGGFGYNPVGYPPQQQQQPPGCPLCDSSVYSYCSHKMIHDACCCDFPAATPQLRPQQCNFYDCSLLYAKSCYEHALIKNCCCNNPY